MLAYPFELCYRIGNRSIELSEKVTNFEVDDFLNFRCAKLLSIWNKKMKISSLTHLAMLPQLTAPQSSQMSIKPASRAIKRPVPSL